MDEEELSPPQASAETTTTERFHRGVGLRLVGSRHARHLVYHPAGLPLAYVLLRGTAGPHREDPDKNDDEEEEMADTEVNIYGSGGPWEEDDPDFAKHDKEPEQRRAAGLPLTDDRFQFNYPPNKVEKLFPEFFAGSVLPPSIVEDFHLKALLGISEWDGAFRDALREWNVQASRSDKTEARLALLLSRTIQTLLETREEQDLGKTGLWTVATTEVDEDAEEGRRSSRRRRWSDNNDEDDDDDDSTDPGEPRDYGPPAGDIVATHPGYDAVFETDDSADGSKHPPPPVRMVIEVGIGNDKWWKKFDRGIDRLQRMKNFTEAVVYVVLTLDLNEDDPDKAVVTSSKIAAFLVTPGMTDLKVRGGGKRLDHGYEIALLWHRRQHGLPEVSEGIGRVLRAVSMTPCWMSLSKQYLACGGYRAVGRNHARYKYKVRSAFACGTDHSHVYAYVVESLRFCAGSERRSSARTTSAPAPWRAVPNCT
jgi:hypothetical protein